MLLLGFDVDVRQYQRIHFAYWSLCNATLRLLPGGNVRMSYFSFSSSFDRKTSKLTHIDYMCTYITRGFIKLIQTGVAAA